MRYEEVYGLAQVVKEANGLQLHSIATMAMNRLREIEAEAKAELAKIKAPVVVAAQPKEPSAAEAAVEDDAGTSFHGRRRV